MSVNLKFSNHIHDTFIHVPTSIYMKLFTQLVPLIQLTSDKTFSFWCVQDSSLPEGIVNVNPKFAEIIDLKSGASYKISLGPAKCINLSKVIVSLLNGAEDWRFLNENYENIQNFVLDQLRLIKRGQCYPIFTNLRHAPLWIKIEEFGGYQSSDMLGIISNDTELVIIDYNDDQGINRLDTEIPTLLAVPSVNFTFLCNPCHKVPEICSYRDEYFRISTCDSVPPNVLLVPDLILSDFFNLMPKDKILLSPGVKYSESYSGTFNFSLDESLCEFDPNQHPNETIISTSNGIVVKTSKIDFDQITQIRPLNLSKMNVLTQFLLDSSHKFILFHGQPGSGKSKNALEAVNQLNYDPKFFSQAIYIDLLSSPSNINVPEEKSIVAVIDHLDEYLQPHFETDEKNIMDYILLFKKIRGILQSCNENRVVLISRSIRVFSNFSSIVPLQFDHIFALENSKHWEFKVNPEPLTSVFGLNEAKYLLERYILSPLQFSHAFITNQMDVHSSVLICGPPGSGKTFLAHKFIEHHKIPCIYVRGPEILDKYVGASERGVRDLFSRARNIKPSVIFFDEIDSLVPKRGSNQSGVTDRIVNQFLTELDGTEDRSGVFIIATTSRPDLIDKAILRPGRIDQKIELNYPRLEEVKEFILSKGIKSKKLKALVNFVGSDTNLAISWADLVSIDWNDSSTAITNLIQAVSIKKNTSQTEKSNRVISQKLTLA